MIKKSILILLTFLLVGCGSDISGTWVDKNDIVEITFDQDKVVFFDVEGSYKIRGSKIKMELGLETVEYKFELNEDQLILFIEETELILERQFQ